MTQRIEPFFFLNTTQRKEPFFECDSNWNFWLKISQQNSKLFFSHDPKNRTRFFSIWLKELNLFRLDSKIWCYSVWPKELNFFWLGLTELDPFLEYDSENWIFSWVFYMSTFFKNDAENWTLFSLNMTQRIEPFFSLNVTQRIEPFFLWMWRQELELFLNMTQRIEPFSYLKQRNELLFLWYEWLQELFFQTKNTQWIELFEIWLKELNIWTMCQKEDSESGTLLKFFLKWLIELNLFFFEPFQDDSKSWSLFSIWLKELNPLFFSKRLKELNIFFFSKNAQRIEPLFHLNYFFTWLNELNFFQFDSKSWVFSNMTQRVGFFFFWIWLKNLNLRLSMTQRSDPFWTWLKEVNFFEHYSENRTLFLRRRKELNLFLNLTQRIDFSQNDAKNWNLFSKYDAKNWNFFFEYDSKNWTFFSDMTQRKKSEKRLKELNLFFFPIWLTELNLFFFHLYDSKNWTLCPKKKHSKKSKSSL